MRDSSDLVGKTLGACELEKLIGQGGMGASSRRHPGSRSRHVVVVSGGRGSSWGSAQAHRCWPTFYGPGVYDRLTPSARGPVPMPNRSVFFVSDGTGITAETFGNSILAQFGIRHRHVRRPFIDTVAKARHVVAEINAVAEAEQCRPVVFVTLVNA